MQTEVQEEVQGGEAGLEALTPAMLARASPKQQQNLIGERLYLLISSVLGSK